MNGGFFGVLLVFLYLFVSRSYGQSRGCRDFIPSNFCNIYKSNNLCNTGSSNIQGYLRRNCRKTCRICTEKGSFLWSNWSQYSQCTESCGGGRQRRTRYCIGIGSSRRCGGSRVQIRRCSTNNCSTWSKWIQFGQCNVSCGGGMQEERRTCVSGSGCAGPNSRNQLSCNTQDCPPEWSRWGAYGECSTTCGGGLQEERRSCVNGTSCTGPSTRSLLSCNNETCPSDIGPWSSWSNCSATCGKGHIIKQRKCGVDCVEYAHEECKAASDCKCNKQCCSDNSRYRFFCKRAGRIWCKLDFTAKVCRKTCNRCPDTCVGCEPAYSKWSSWGNCTVKCGGGLRLRFRNCNRQNGCTDGSYYENATCANETCANANNSTWGPWLGSDNCSATCGGGVKNEIRICQNGTDCKGFSSRQVECNTERCNITIGTWESWNKNGTCTKTCGGGKRTEIRSCLNGTSCIGNTRREVECNNQKCPIWAAWKPGSCSVTCGKGKQTDTRKCMYGPGCTGNKTRSVDCNTQPCPYWGEWRNTTSCSVTCGPGIIRQLRNCTNAPGCHGLNSREKMCNQGECESPVWGKWKKEGDCSLTCGGGTQQEVRVCRNGIGCTGNRSRQVRCNEQICPAWGAWKSQGECSSTCGGGKELQTRDCLNSLECPGNNSRIYECSTQPCPSWGIWKPQSNCSRPCGGGSQNETRSCRYGSDCKGDSRRTVDCNNQLCSSANDSAVWDEWSQWSRCPVTCGRGYRNRSRKCKNGTKCFGQSTQEDTCTAAQVCPCKCPPNPNCVEKYAGFCRSVIESQCKTIPAYKQWCPSKCGVCRTCDPCGTWESWKDVTECSEVCGNGTITRERVCPTGNTCNGLTIDTFACSLASCDQPHWSTWGQWSDCSESCEGGEQSRIRNCSLTEASACGNLSSQVETRSCNTVACNATWSNWRSWGKCSRNCGPGVQRRRRHCPGRLCAGSSRDERACTLKPCPTSNIWSSCSRTCGTGTRTRLACEDGKCETLYEDCGNTCANATCTLPMLKRYKSRGYECCHHQSPSVFTCGISSPNEGRIINGVDALLAQWPWMVLLRTADDSLCGGTLITRYIVLTAAHCVRGKFPSEITLRLGALQFDDQNVHVQARNVSRIFVHPLFDFPMNDIAILQLEKPAILGGTYVKTICLPQNENIPDDTTCVAAGWGLTKPRTSWSSTIATVLQEVELRVVNFDICQKGYRDENNVKDKMNADSMVCAGKILGGVDTCNGDSGGPLMCQRCSSCAWFLHGLTSFGSVECGVANKPGVYTKISYFSNFINKVAGEVQSSLPPTERRTDELNIADGNYSSCT